MELGGLETMGWGFLDIHIGHDWVIDVTYLVLKIGLLLWES